MIREPDWMLGKLESYCASLLAPGRLRRHGLLNVDTVQDAWERYRHGDRRLAPKVWNLAMFQVWWEAYFG